MSSVLRVGSSDSKCFSSAMFVSFVYSCILAYLLCFVNRGTDEAREQRVGT